MPSDLIIDVRQVSSYPELAASFGTETVLLQQGGLGGPYASISTANLVATALNSGPAMGIGAVPPGNASDNQLFVGALNLPPVSQILWDAYLTTSDAEVSWTGGQAASFGWQQSVGWNWATAPISPGPLQWFNLMLLDPAGSLHLPLGTLTVARDPAGAFEVATANWVSNNTVHSFNNRNGQVILNANDVYAALKLCDPLATQPWVNQAITNNINNLLYTCPFVNTWNGRQGQVYLMLSDITCVFYQSGQQPISPTPPATSNDDSIATTAWVTTAIEGAGEFLPIAGGTLTGNLTLPSLTQNTDDQSTFGATPFAQINLFNASVPGRMIDFNKVGSASTDTSIFSGNYIVNDTGGAVGSPRFMMTMNTSVQTSPLSGIWTGHFVTTSQRVGGNLGENGDLTLDLQAIRSSASPIGNTTVTATLGAPNSVISVADVTNFATGYYPPGNPNTGQPFSMVANTGIAIATASATVSGNVLNMANVNGLNVGMAVFGNANIPLNTIIQSIAGNAVTISNNVTGAIGGGVGIDFMWGMMVKVGATLHILINTSAASGAGTLTFANPVSVADGTAGNQVLSQQGGGPLWAAVLDLQDQTGLPSSASGVMLGVELDMSGNDVDDGDNIRLGNSLAQPYQGLRNMMTFIISKYNAAGPDYQVASGLVFGPGSAGASMGRVLYPALPFYVAALDTRDATQMSGACAIWLADNQTIALTTSGQAGATISGAGNDITLTGAGVRYSLAGADIHTVAFGWDGALRVYIDGGFVGHLTPA